MKLLMGLVFVTGCIQQTSYQPVATELCSDFGCDWPNTQPNCDARGLCRCDDVHVCYVFSCDELACDAEPACSSDETLGAGGGSSLCSCDVPDKNELSGLSEYWCRR